MIQPISRQQTSYYNNQNLYNNPSPLQQLNPVVQPVFNVNASIPQPINQVQPLQTIQPMIQPVQPVKQSVFQKPTGDIATGAGIAYQGLAAGMSQQVPTSDSVNGVLNTLMAGVSGGVGGLMAGGPIGGLVGGGLGLLTGGLNSWLNVRDSRKKKREQEKYLEEIAAENAVREREDKQRYDESVSYNKDEAKKAQMYEVYNNVRGNILNALNSNIALKDKFIKMGYV